MPSLVLAQWAVHDQLPDVAGASLSSSVALLGIRE